MHTIVLKKNIKAKFIVEELAFINLDNKIDYHQCGDGVQATGEITLDGEYYNGGRHGKFNDRIDVDIYVPSEKITSRNEIMIKINDFDYRIDNDQIIFAIKVDIEGLKEDIKSFPTTTEEDYEETLLLNDRVEEEKTYVEEPKVIESKVIEKKVLEEKVVVEKKMSNETIVKKNYTQVCFSYHVVLKGDSYESIGEELKVDAMKLRSANKNKPLSEGMLLTIPS